MIVKNSVNDIEFGNVEHGGEFKIRNSAKAFSILSSGLYQNKIRAIIRELSCNAVDSHKANGTPEKQFHVHLPTRLEPHFSIRDFGTGLTHEQVITIYTTYFESTKTTSNEFIGALGLGSKSPFSYTDNFSVTAIKDGVKNIYTAYINEHGIPAISRMTTLETDEESGVEVSFPVNESDFSKFNDEASYVYTFFDVKPKITGNYYPTTVKLEELVDGVYTYEYNSKFSGAYALMGNIVYPLSVPNAETNLGTLADILVERVLIKFDIGELDISASRESLSYIPLTIQSIKLKLDKVSKNLTNIVSKKIDVETNAWKRLDLLDSLYNSRIMRHSAMTYAIDKKFPLIQSNGNTDRQVMLDFDTVSQGLNIEITSIRATWGKPKLEGVFSKYNPQTLKNDQYYRVLVDLGTKILQNPDNKKILTRAKNYVRDYMQSNNQLIILTPLDKTKPMQVDKLMKMLHNPPKECLIDIADLPETPKATRTSVAVGEVLESSNDVSNARYARNSWGVFDINNIDASKTYYYVKMKARQVVSDRFGSMSLNDYCKIFCETQLDFTKVQIVGIKESAMSEIFASGGTWIHYEDYVLDSLNNVLTDQNFYDKLAFRSLNSFLNHDRIFNLIENKDSPFIKIVNRFKDIKHTSVDEYWVKQIVKRFDLKYDIDEKLQLVVEEHEKLYIRYPLIHNQLFYDNTNKSAVAEYINLIDKSKGV